MRVGRILQVRGGSGQDFLNSYGCDTGSNFADGGGSGQKVSISAGLYQRDGSTFSLTLASNN